MNMPIPGWAAFGIPVDTELFPGGESTSSYQARQSNYYGNEYVSVMENTVNGIAEQDRPVYNQFTTDADQEKYVTDHARYVADIVHYMMATMEPTDRCLRMPGDIYPADGTHLGKRGTGDRPPVPGNDPWDGISDVPPASKDDL